MATTVRWGAADSSDNAPKSVEAAATRPGFLADVERAKGLAIILVVLGHVVAREWYVLN
jgi:uncharacterized membrane protein YcfT